MLKLYYASAIDTCTDKALEQIEKFKKILEPYTLPKYGKNGVIHPIEIYGAGFGTNPIIDPNTSSDVYKGAVTAYDLRKLRECDILLVVTDLKQFCAGTMMELEYARQLGIYIILYITRDLICENCGKKPSDECIECKDFNATILKNIFLETYTNKIIYSIEELEEILKELTK